MILIFDATNQESFQSLELWKEIVAIKKPPVMICIANKIDLLDGKDFQSQRDLWLNWCLDNEFELIECSAVSDEAQGIFRFPSNPRIIFYFITSKRLQF